MNIQEQYQNFVDLYVLTRTTFLLAETSFSKLFFC